VFRVATTTGSREALHIGSSSTKSGSVERRARWRGGRAGGSTTRWPRATTGCFSGKLLAVPEVEARVLRRPDRLDPVPLERAEPSGSQHDSGSTEGTHPRGVRRRPVLLRRICGGFTADHQGCTRCRRSVRTTSASRPTTRHTDTRGPTERVRREMLAGVDGRCLQGAARGNANQGGDVGGSTGLTSFGGCRTPWYAVG